MADNRGPVIRLNGGPGKRAAVLKKTSSNVSAPPNAWAARRPTTPAGHWATSGPATATPGNGAK